MNLENVNNLIESSDRELALALEISDKIVGKYTSALDDLMRDIKQNIIDADNPPTIMIEQYFMELSTAYYFVAPKCEILGLQDDMAKTTAKIKYNDAYGTKQIEESGVKKKPTVAELTVAAEMASLDESLVSNIYSRSYRIVKAKLEAASTMIATLSKIISSHDTERKLTGVVDI